MTSNAFSVKSYHFTPEDELFLDANIWLCIYGPQKPRSRRVQTYSQALAKILAANSRIYIDVLIVSEFINAYARIKWNIMRSPGENFKKFRKSPEFKPIAQDIADVTKRVLRHCTRVDNGFDSLDIERLMSEYAKGNSDFNDQVIADICQRRGLKLVTDDGDFRGLCIPVVTANKRLLS